MKVVQRGARRGRRREVAKTWLPVNRIGFDPGWVRKRRQKSDHPVVVEIRHIQIAAERIYRQAQRRVEALHGSRSVGEINSTTKSGHRGRKRFFCSLVNCSSRLLCTQEASGDSAAPSGRMYSALESNALPRPARLDHATSWTVRSLVRNPVSAPAGGMMMISPWAFRSMRSAGFFAQDSKNSS